MKKNALDRLLAPPTTEAYDNHERYTYEAVVKASTEAFNGDEMAAQVFAQKYALHDEAGRYLELTPEDMHKRLASELARVSVKRDIEAGLLEGCCGGSCQDSGEPQNSKHEQVVESTKAKLNAERDRILNLLADYDEDGKWRGMGAVCLQGSPMSAIGNPFKLQSAANCFVLDQPYDSYSGIMHTDQQLAQLMKRRAGVGVDISTLRPKGLPTKNAAKTTDGISVFMERFSNTCREVAQGGRRGAEMITIDCHHPEVLNFINIKRDTKKVTGANISVRFSQEFFDALEEGGDVELRFPVEPGLPSSEYLVKELVPAKDIWKAAMQAAWESAEPGALFWNVVKRESPSDIYEEEGFGSISTNPCGEIVLNGGDSCRLTALNLKAFLVNPWKSDARFDFDKLREVSYAAQEIMDLVVDLEVELVDRILAKIEADPEPEFIKSVERNLWSLVRDVALKGRRTGLGFTALGDSLAAVGIRYGSDEGIRFSEEITRNIAAASFASSVNMAKTYGPFPIFKAEKEKGHPFVERVLGAMRDLGYEREASDFWQHGRRNISLTTVAPTGSLSILTQSTSGIESVFMPYYTRRRKLSDDEINQGLSVDFIDELGDKWHEYPVFHHGLRDWMLAQGVEDPESLSEDQIAFWVEQSPYHNATAMDQDWEAGVRLQGSVQKWISHSISRTANLPSDAPVELIDKIYREAWRAGCKGYTVYRDGSRSGVLVSNEDSTVEESIPFNDAPKRPESLPVNVHRIRYKGEEWTVLVGMLDEHPFEVFAGPVEDLPVTEKAKEVEIVKHPRKTKGARYELRWINGDGAKNVRDIAKALEAEHNTLTRLTSLSLRHGAKIQYVVEQLQRDESSFLSFSRVLARTLKNYIPDGTKGDRAAFADCETPDLCEPIYMEGCLSCGTCGKSRCG